VWIIPLTISLTSPSPTVSVEFDQKVEESQLPTGITPEICLHLDCQPADILEFQAPGPDAPHE
jgi:hypothetical protein